MDINNTARPRTPSTASTEVPGQQDASLEHAANLDSGRDPQHDHGSHHDPPGEVRRFRFMLYQDQSQNIPPDASRVRPISRDRPGAEQRRSSRHFDPVLPRVTSGSKERDANTTSGAGDFGIHSSSPKRTPTSSSAPAARSRSIPPRIRPSRSPLEPSAGGHQLH